MSRIGRQPVVIPAGVTVEIGENNKVTVKGPKGTLERVLPAEMKIEKDGDSIVVSRPNELKRMKSLHGLTRTLIHNMVIGVTEGYKKELEVNGVGYRAQKQGKTLVLSLGYSHPVEMVDEGFGSASGPLAVQLVEDGLVRAVTHHGMASRLEDVHRYGILPDVCHGSLHGVEDLKRCDQKWRFRAVRKLCQPFGR